MWEGGEWEVVVVVVTEEGCVIGVGGGGVEGTRDGIGARRCKRILRRW